MPALDASLRLTLDEPLTKIVTAAPMMPLDDAGIDQATAQSLTQWLRENGQVSPNRLAGLWLLAGDLDRSHTISQSIETPVGSYWHGIMHRREGDYFNAKYWMRRTSGHPVTSELQRRCPNYQDALAFVDSVEKAVTRDRSLKEAMQDIQWLEWQLLIQCDE